MSTSLPEGSGLTYVKGHGTENDFVIVPDVDATLTLPAALVAAICDRRAGMGADGLLRVVPTEAVPEVAAQAAQAAWFMDYRNGDGSVAEMCGNGVRVFARYLADAGLVRAQSFGVATRGGVKQVRFEDDGQITVDMGRAVLPPELARVSATVDGRTYDGVGVLMPNPHAVVFVNDLSNAGTLSEPPPVAPAAAYPDGANVEFVVRRGPDHVAFRVHERGVGETRSCGTGAAAVAVVSRRQAGHDVEDDAGRRVRIDVPGGRLVAYERPDGRVELTGPAVLVAEGRLSAAWLEAALAGP